jgi:hypothetical protein
MAEDALGGGFGAWDAAAAAARGGCHWVPPRFYNTGKKKIRSPMINTKIWKFWVKLPPYFDPFFDQVGHKE